MKQTRFPVLAYSLDQYNQFLANQRLDCEDFPQIFQFVHLYGYPYGSKMVLLPDSMVGLDASQLLNRWMEQGNGWVALNNDHVIGREPLPASLRTTTTQGPGDVIVPAPLLEGLKEDLRAILSRLERISS